MVALKGKIHSNLRKQQMEKCSKSIQNNTDVGKTTHSRSCIKHNETEKKNADKTMRKCF